MAPEKNGFRIRDLFFSNIVAKLMALAMALALWFYAYNFSIARKVTYTIPVKVLPVRGWSNATEEGRAVNVKLDFPQRFEREVERAYDARKIYVECRGAPEKDEGDEETLLIPLKESLHLKGVEDYGILSARFNPPAVTVRIVRHDTVPLRVLLKYTNPPEGYAVGGETSVSPVEVKAHGRKDILRKAEVIETELVDISKRLPVTVADWVYEDMVALKQSVTVDEVELPVTCAEKVKYRIKLALKPVHKTFSKVPINLMPSKSDFTVKLLGEKEAEVMVSGPGSVVNKLDRENIVLYVRPGNRKPNKLPYTLPIRADFVDIHGQSALSVKLKPSTMDVSIRKE